MTGHGGRVGRRFLVAEENTVPMPLETLHQASATMRKVLYEIKRVIVGQDADARTAAGRRCSPAGTSYRRRAGPGQDAGDRAPPARIDCDFKRIQFTPDLLPADLIGTRIYNQRAASSTSSRPDLRELRPGRRDQPGAGQGAVGAARGDAGAPGLRSASRRSNCRSRSSCWPRRTPSRGGHLSAARGAGGPLHVQGRHRVSDATTKK